MDVNSVGADGENFHKKVSLWMRCLLAISYDRDLKNLKIYNTCPPIFYYSFMMELFPLTKHP